MPYTEIPDPSCENALVRGTLHANALDLEESFIMSDGYVTPSEVRRWYVRPAGSNIVGDGTSVATAWATFAHAILQLALFNPPGRRNIVNVDGCTETFAAGYNMPAIHSAASLDQQIPFATDPWSRFWGAVHVEAVPQPLSTIPLADTAIALADVFALTADPNDGFYTLELNAVRASWAGNALRNAIFRSTGPTTTVGQADGVVYESTDNNGAGRAQLRFTVSSQVPGSGGAAIVPVGPFTIMEQSATFQGTSGPTGGTGAFNVFNVDSVSFMGISFVNTTSFLNPCMVLRSPSSAWAFVLCKFAGRTSFQGGGSYLGTLETCCFHSQAYLDAQCVGLSIRKCFFNQTLGFSTMPDTGVLWYQSCVWNGCQPVGKAEAFKNLTSPQQAFNSALSGGLSLFFTHCRVQAGISHGFELAAGGTMQWCTSQNNGGHGVYVHESGRPTMVMNVVGAGNATIGLKVENHSPVRVTAGTTVTGAGGDLQVGNNGVRTWANFRGVAPINNENDLAAGTASQFCRVWQ